MSEGIKTGIFWIAAAAVAAAAIVVAWPRSDDEAALVQVGKPLFEEFTDPLAATSMRIVTFDETMGELDSFEVAKDKQTGVWTIPSREGYPADASSQMEAAGTALLNLKILDVKASSPEDHADYGVVEPNIEQLRVGDSGVGRQVTIRNENGDTLVSLIVGDQVKDFPTHRYVRIPGQDPVYEVELDDSPLTTDFRKWIEDDLLKLSTFDIAGAKIRNYAATLNISVQTGSFVPSMKRSYDANLSVDEKSSQWNLDSLVVYDDTNVGTVESIGEGEKLNTAKLDAMKRALDDLKIVDVRRKPAGMSADLKADKSLVSDTESVRSLIERGFYPARSAEGDVDVLAANGEMLVDQRDGIEYVLRFGGIAGIDEGSEEASEAESPEEAADAQNADEEETSTGGSNRYLLVTARVNKSLIPPPEVQAVPQTIEELEALLNPPAADEPIPGDVQDNPLAEPQEGDAQEVAPSAEEEAATEQPAEQEAADGESESVEEGSVEEVTESQDVEASGEGQTDVSGSGEGSGQGQAADPQPPTEEAPQAVAEDEGAEAVEEEPAAEEPADEETTEETPKETDVDEPADEETDADGEATADEPADEPASPALEAPENSLAGLTDEEKQERLEAEQEKIIKQNQRNRDAWKEKMDAANARVRDLNSRFADWYYIIPESTYADLQIKLDALITDANAAGATPPQGSNPAAGPSFPFGIGQ